MREIIQQILGDQFGSIHWVGDGNKVLAKAAEMIPETIVLDISLPGISGLILLPVLREAHPRTSIVMLTNHADDLYRRQAFARGADAYVLKSRANKDLVPAIWAGRQQPAHANGAPAVAG
jgi:DNA-binding NarL/FixJ family response regulator